MRSASRLLRNARVRFGLVGLVQIHHIIPLQHRHHPALTKVNFDIDAARNIMFMPTFAGVRALQLRSGRLVHDGGHAAYNSWVGTLLSDVSTDRDVDDLLRYLHTELRKSDADIPWR